MSNNQTSIWENTILRTAALIGAIVIIITQLNNLVVSTNTVGPAFFKVILAGLNAIALLVYCFFSTKTPNLSFDEDLSGRDGYAKLLSTFDDKLDEENSKKLADKYHNRVNLLAKQLNSNLLYWALLLTITYILYIFDDKNNKELHFPFKVAEDLSNFLSSVFLYLAFKVLYDKTLEEDNSKFNYYVDSIIVSGLYILAYIFFAIVQVNTKVEIETVNNIFSLLSGTFNGLAMTLLFARYVSMEHTVTKIDKVKYSDIITLLTTLLLPLYTLAQPLFGSFEIKAFGDPQSFQNYVFLICLCGKIFFLYMTFYFLKKKLVHLYLHTVLTRHASSDKISDCFEISK